MSIVQLPFESHFTSAPDGLRLHVRDYGSRLDPGVPVVCLAGLTRNSADFGPFGERPCRRADKEKRRVLALDYRGRGLSDYDRNWENYTLEVENSRCFIGSHRHGDRCRNLYRDLARRPPYDASFRQRAPLSCAGAVLNDIGPVLEPHGMARIRGYVGKLPVPRTILGCRQSSQGNDERTFQRPKRGRLGSLRQNHLHGCQSDASACAMIKI